MSKIEMFGGFEDWKFGVGYSWKETQDRPKVSQPIVDIQGTGGNGWAKETNGSVRIHGVPGRTSVKVSGPRGWKITGHEEIG